MTRCQTLTVAASVALLGQWDAVYAERTVTSTSRRLQDVDEVNAETLVAALIGSSSELVATNAVLSCGDGASGLATFEDTGHAFEELGIGSRENIVLTTGDAAIVQETTNTFTGAGADLGEPGDSDLDDTFDACSLSFDLSLAPDLSGSAQVCFAYIFMSEEYPEFVDEYNDVFQLLVDGVNVATLPNEDDVSINSVNFEDNVSLFNDNELGSFNTEYDGFTEILDTSFFVVHQGQASSVKLVIADRSDAYYDSAVVIQGNSMFIGDMGNDPHVYGLHGQNIDFHGAEGAWYCLFADYESHLQVNVRVTAPLPESFPERQYITGVSVLSNDHSLVIEVVDPYSTRTGGCPDGTSPCLANGALKISVDGEVVDELLGSAMGSALSDGIILSASNLPSECREFGGGRAWAMSHKNAIEEERSRLLKTPSFEEWIISSGRAVSPESCAKYVAAHGLLDVQSEQAAFEVAAPSMVVRFGIGVNHRNGGKRDRSGRLLPDLDFWQGSVTLGHVDVDRKDISGLIGETACPVLDASGEIVLRGPAALRGAVPDYQVDGPLGKDFALVREDCPIP